MNDYQDTRLESLFGVPKCNANLYWICLSIPQICTKAEADQICGKFWDTQYVIITR